MDDIRLIRRAVSLAMQCQDDFVLELTYTDKRGAKTRRTVSPVRFVDQHQFAALCLCREEPRCFYFARCSDVLLVHASEVVMPVEIETLEHSVI